MKRGLPLLGLFLLLAGCATAPVVPATPTALPPHSPAQPTEVPAPPPAVGPTRTVLPTEAPGLPTPTTVPLVIGLRPLAGDLSDQLALLEDTMPGLKSERFIVPTTAELTTMAELVYLVLSGEAGRAGRIAAENGYELIAYTDRGDGEAQDLLLCESVPGRKGWGWYAFRQGAAQDVVIEAPHPLADEGTPRIALQLYRALSARALLIAGAHRQANLDGSADVAHSARTVFESVHEALVAANRPVVIQVHGFSAGKHPGYPQIVLSDYGSAAPLLERLEAALQQRGIRVGRCGSGEWADLCGETNVQAGHVGQGGLVHLEMDETIRADATPLVQAIAQALRAP